MPGESKTSPRRLEAALRSKQALELRMAGVNFDQIANKLGYSNRSGAYQAVMAALRRLPAPEVEEYRKLNIERLNKARMANWPNVTGGEHKAIEIEIKIQQREAAYLGLDAPQKVALGGADGGPVTLRVIYDDDNDKRA